MRYCQQSLLPGIQPWSGHHLLANSLNDFNFEAAGPVFIMGPPWVKWMKVCSNGFTLSTKMATKPEPLKFWGRILVYRYRGVWCLFRWFATDLYTARSNLIPHIFVWGKCWSCILRMYWCLKLKIYDQSSSQTCSVTVKILFPWGYVQV